MKAKKKKIKKYPNGGFTSTLAQGITAGLSGIAGETNSNLGYKQDEQFDVSDSILQKGLEAGFGSNPISSAFMGIGQAGESILDSVSPGLGEGIFAPHKGITRAIKEGNAEYAIPIVGSVLAAKDAKMRQGQEESRRSVELNPYGDQMLRYGGALMQYDAPTHENGGQMITQSGVPTNNPDQAVAEIEKKETMHDGYVFSDTLKHKSGKTFAAVSKALDSKFKKKNTPIDKRTRNLQMDMLKRQNDAARALEESTNRPDQFPNGGEIDPTTQPGQILGGDIYFSGAAFDTNQLANLGLQHPNQVNTRLQAQGTPTGLPTTDLATITPTGIEQTFDLPGATPLGIQDNNVANNIVSSPVEKAGMDYLTPARVGKGIELAGKAGILAQGYDTVNPQLNPNAQRVAALMRNRKVDNQALLNQITGQRNAALASNQNARSLNVRRSLDQRTYNAAARQALQAKLSEQTQNAAFRGQEAQVLSQLGSEEARANVYAEDATARNKGQFYTNLGTVLGDVGRAGAFESKVKVNDIQVAESLALLGSKYENFGIDAKTYKRLKEGKYTLNDIEKLQDGLLKYKT